MQGIKVQTKIHSFYLIKFIITWNYILNIYNQEIKFISGKMNCQGTGCGLTRSQSLPGPRQVPHPPYSIIISSRNLCLTGPVFLYSHRFTINSFSRFSDFLNYGKTIEIMNLLSVGVLIKFKMYFLKA